MDLNEKYIDRFINEKERSDPDNFRKGRFFIFSVYLLLVLMTFVTPFLILSVPSQMIFTLVFNTIVLILLTLVILVYKKFGKRILLANFITALLTVPFFATYDENGGIFSSDNIICILIGAWSFLVADKKSGVIWYLIMFGWWIFLFYANQLHAKDFLSDFNKMGADYHLLNYLSCGIFMLLIIFLYEQGKEKYLKEVMQSKAEIELQKKELESKNKDITDSVIYAKKIQHAVLPSEESIERNIPLSFILYTPKDIVSGDFFWFHAIDRDNYILVCADCTGHGVPGAMMTVVGSNLLNQIIIENQFSGPSSILSELDNKINSTLKQEKVRLQSVQDGMDLSLIKVNKAKKEFTFTSAKRPAIFFRNNQMQEFKGSKFSLGGMRMGAKKFEEIQMNFEEDDIIYFYTDGVTDQFGGEKGKKYSSKRFKETLQSIHPLSMPEQKQKLESTIENWKGRLEQVDDILVMGIRF